MHGMPDYTYLTKKLDEIPPVWRDYRIGHSTTMQCNVWYGVGYQHGGNNECTLGEAMYSA